METGIGRAGLRDSLYYTDIYHWYGTGSIAWSTDTSVDSNIFGRSGAEAIGCSSKAGGGVAGRNSFGDIWSAGAYDIKSVDVSTGNEDICRFRDSSVYRWCESDFCGFVLAIMILPTVINISESALERFRCSSRRLRLQWGLLISDDFKVILPAAKSGIITAIVLGVGRAIGEAMAISLVSGSAVNLPLPFNSVRFLTTAIVSEMGYAADLHRQVLFTIGLVLFAFVMFINVTLTRILKKGEVEND